MMQKCSKRCSAIHNALGQLANQNRLRLLEGRDFVENQVFERGGA